MRYFIITLIGIFFTNTFIHSQDQTVIDSLNTELTRAKEKEKAQIYNLLSDAYLDYDDDKALSYAQSALELAQTYSNEEQIALSYFSLAEVNYNLREFTQAKDYYTLALEKYTVQKNQEKLSEIYTGFGRIEDRTGNREIAIENYQKAYDLAEEINYQEAMGDNLYYLAVGNYFQRNFEQSRSYFQKSYNLHKERKDTSELASSINGLGIVNFALGNYSEAITYYLEALRINESKQDTAKIASNLTNIASVYKAMSRYTDAEEYYLKALEIYSSRDNKENMSSILHNLGLLADDKISGNIDSDNYTESELREIYKESLNYYNEALNLREEIGDSSKINQTLVNIGIVYRSIKRYNQAIVYLERARTIAESRGDLQFLPVILNELGDIYNLTGQPNKAIKYFDESVNIGDGQQDKELMHSYYESMSQAYENKGEYKKALEYFKNFKNINDSIFSENNQKVVAEMQTKYDTEKKEQEIELLNKDKALAEAKSKRDKIIKRVFALGLIIVLAFLSFVIKQLQVIRKKNALLAEQKTEIQAQRDEIQEQRDVVAKQKEEITDSIYYASRIQKAVMPNNEYATNLLHDHFILFRPRDIVSGDFYWMMERDNKAIVVAADCTGHGVPGAFMSMLGVSFLNEIVNSPKIHHSGEILTQLRSYVKSTLGQTGKDGEAKDGMDVALSIIDFKNMKVEYSGAYNPLYLYRNGELIETKADKMPIGIYIKEKDSFTTNEIEVQKGDVLYMFSDGFVDQFGGEKGKKFMAKPFKRLLSEIHTKPMEEQREILNTTIDNWRGDIDQIDDILVIGIRI